VLNATAELLDFRGAGALHRVLEVNVLSHADLCIKQRGAALVSELLPSILKTPDYARASLYLQFAISVSIRKKNSRCPVTTMAPAALPRMQGAFHVWRRIGYAPNLEAQLCCFT